MTKDKDAGRREHGETKPPEAPTTLDRMKALTRKLLTVPKAEIDERERGHKSRARVH